MAKDTNTILIILGIGILAYLAFSGGLFGGNQAPPEEDDDNDVPSDEPYPSNLQTAITLNTYDALTTTTTAANVSYYVFKKSGEFVSTGTTSAGTASFNVPYGEDYMLVAWDDTGNPDYIPAQVDFSATSSEGAKTINMLLMLESNATISSVRDPVDLNGNISLPASSTSNFEVVWKTTTSDAAVNKPILVADVNQTTIDTVSFTGASLITCPTRLTTASSRKKLCFSLDKVVKTADGIQINAGTVKSTSTAPETGALLEMTVIDRTAYLDADYVSKGYSALHLSSAENAAYSNIGATDSNSLAVQYNG